MVSWGVHAWPCSSCHVLALLNVATSDCIILNLKENGEASKRNHAGCAKDVGDAADQKLMHHLDVHVLLQISDEP